MRTYGTTGPTQNNIEKKYFTQDAKDLKKTQDKDKNDNKKETKIAKEKLKNSSNSESYQKIKEGKVTSPDNTKTNFNDSYQGEPTMTDDKVHSVGEKASLKSKSKKVEKMKGM